FRAETGPVPSALWRCGMGNDSAGIDDVWRSAARITFADLADCAGGIAGMASTGRKDFDCRGLRCWLALVVEYRHEVPDACVAIGGVSNPVECGSTHRNVSGDGPGCVELSSAGTEVCSFGRLGLGYGDPVEGCVAFGIRERLSRSREC